MASIFLLSGNDLEVYIAGSVGAGLAAKTFVEL